MEKIIHIMIIWNVFNGSSNLDILTHLKMLSEKDDVIL